MATQHFRVIPDENKGVHYGGAFVDKETKDNKTVRKPGLSGSRPLANITNSGKPSHVNVLKNFATKAGDAGVDGGTSILLQNNALNAQKKVPLSTRKALADISNSKKSTAHQTSFLRQNNAPDIPKKSGSVVGRRALADISNTTKKSSQSLKSTCSKKLDKLVEEQFLHNHQECVYSVSRGLDVESFYTTLGFTDDFSVDPGTPLSLPESDERKTHYASPPKYMEYEDVPDFLNEPRFSSHCGGILDISTCHQFPNGYPSPDFKLRMSP